MAKNNDKPTGFMGALWGNVSGFFAAQAKTIWTDFIPTAETVIGSLFSKLFWALNLAKDLRWNKFFTRLEKMKAIDEDTKKDLLDIKNLDQPLEFIGWAYVFVAFYGAYLKGLAYAITGDLRRKLNRDYEPEIIPYADALRTAFIDPTKLLQVKSLLKESGFNDSEIELLFISMYRRADEGTIRQMYFRDVITKTQMFGRMKELGYTEERIKDIIQVWPVIPSLGDIVRYIAKEAFEPEMIELFGLLEGYPVEAEKWAKMQGLDKRWVEAEWVAHWKDLGIDFMLEAYHRNIVQWPLVERYMALIEIPPKLREIVRDTAFRVYTRVDVRRMHDLGVLDDDELVSAYLDQGYDEIKAANMAQFTIRYNAQHQKDLTKSEILTGFREDIINRSDAKEMLLELEYSEPEAEYYVVYEEHKKNKDLEKLLLNNIKDRFQNNLIDETVCRDKLAKLGIASNRINALVEQWLIDKFEDRKIPSKTDLDKFYKVGLIDIDRFYDELRILGYNDDYSKLYVNLAEQTKKGK